MAPCITKREDWMLSLSSRQALSIQAAFQADTSTPRSAPPSLSLHVPTFQRLSAEQPAAKQRQQSDCVVVPNTTPAPSTACSSARVSSTESFLNVRQAQFTIRLVTCVGLFVCNALILAIANAIMTPENFWIGGLLSGPVFSSALIFLTLSSHNVPLRLAGFALLYTYPVIFMTLNQWVAWGFCVALSAFISSSHCDSPSSHLLLARLSWVGLPFIAVGGPVLIVIHTPAQMVWGAMIAVLCLQLMLGFSRLQSSKLLICVSH